MFKHTAVNTIVDGCHLRCNPYGYPSERQSTDTNGNQTNGFETYCLIEL